MNFHMTDQIRATFGSGYHRLAQLEIVTTNEADCEESAISYSKFRVLEAITNMKAKAETSDFAFHAFCRMWLQAWECAHLGIHSPDQTNYQEESHVD